MKLSKNTIFSLILIFLISYPFYEVISKIIDQREYINQGQLSSAGTVGEILAGDIVTQSFKSEADKITSVEVLISNYYRTNKSTLEFGIKEEGSNSNLRTVTIDTEFLRDNEYYTFDFEPIENTKGKSYNFYIKSIDGYKDNSITLHKSEEDTLKSGNLYINGIEQTGDLTFKVNDKETYPRLYIFLIALLAITLLGLFYIFSKHAITVQNGFLLFSIIYGAFFLFFVPFSQTPDEPVHLFRAYEISTGKLVSINNVEGVGNYLPKSLKEVLYQVEHYNIAFHPENKVDYAGYKEAFSMDLEPEDTEFYDFGGSSVYVPIQYIPQSLGLLTGRLLGFSALGIIFLGKLFNLATWIFLIYSAIKLIPLGKELLLTISLFPIVLQQASSLSPDAMLMGISALFIALCVRAYKKPETMAIRDKTILYIIAVAIVLIKIVYLPMLLLLFMIPNESFKNSRTKYFFAIGAIITAVVAAGGWLLYANSELTISVAPFPAVNTGKQIEFAIRNVLYYSEIVRDTLVDNFLFYVQSMIGVMGWLDLTLPFTIILGYLCVVVLLSFFVETIEEGRYKLLMIMSFALGAVLIFSSLYAGWTPVGKDTIDGVQGRYFIPMLLLLPLAGPAVKIEADERNVHRYLYSYINWATNYTLIVLFMRYFIF
ncbi:DUF2142 domain-containing protein [Alloiococcus sp. CFN-8]|uniref:DUF2142 domain-containing protein n=1 Tax=Alloiococcus sp. CFN-8 TaxID=3416081 RepID=UPI003CF24735